MDHRGSIRTMLSSATALLVAFVLALPMPTDAASLSGSRSSVGRQNYQARRHSFTFIRTANQVQRFVANGWLVPVRGNADYTLHAVSFPYARAEVKLFIERLAKQYRASCGEQLVVTSLTRPTTRQPRNASPLSVHPTGMALDLRRSWKSSCRRWLESTLLYLEGRGVLEAARERRPPHYHIAVFPKQYAAYVANLGNEPRDKYYVVRGDTLFSIAQKHATTVGWVKQANGLRGDRIYPGQVLKLPAR
jgi:LysM repeat protein